MKFKPWLKLIIVTALTAVSFTACRNRNSITDIPGTKDIIGNIEYLDSLVKSRETDSLQQALNSIFVKIGEYHNYIQSANDQLIIDSLQLITVPVKDYLQYCVDIRSDLESLRQDVLMIDEQYRSGKIKLTEYLSRLNESDQALVELGESLYTKRDQAFHLISRYRYLSGFLGSPEYLSQPEF